MRGDATVGRGQARRGKGGSLGDAVTGITASTSGCDMLEILGECPLETKSIRGERRRRDEGHQRVLLVGAPLSALPYSACSMPLWWAYGDVCSPSPSMGTSMSCRHVRRPGGLLRV